MIYSIIYRIIHMNVKEMGNDAHFERLSLHFFQYFSQSQNYLGADTPWEVSPLPEAGADSSQLQDTGRGRDMDHRE